MAGITNRAYRVFMRQLGAPAVLTELVSSDSYYNGNRRSREMLQVTAEEGPCGVQIFGAQPVHMAAAAQYAADHGAAFIDINFGCPVPKVTKAGGGSGALLNLPKMREVIRSVRESITIPLSIKSRLGWDAERIVADQVSQLAHDEGVDWYVLHARTREQGYHGSNNWEYTEQLSKNSPCPIVGNGDIHNANQARELWKSGKFSGIMVGRAALVNPCLFSQMQYPELALPTIFELLEHFLDLTLRITPPKIQAVHFKKCAMWMSYSKANSQNFRKRLLQEAVSVNDVMALSRDFYTVNECPEYPSELSFLKGGHG